MDVPMSGPFRFLGPCHLRRQELAEKRLLQNYCEHSFCENKRAAREQDGIRQFGLALLSIAP